MIKQISDTEVAGYVNGKEIIRLHYGKGRWLISHSQHLPTDALRAVHHAYTHWEAIKKAFAVRENEK